MTSDPKLMGLDLKLAHAPGKAGDREGLERAIDSLKTATRDVAIAVQQGWNDHEQKSRERQEEATQDILRLAALASSPTGNATARALSQILAEAPEHEPVDPTPDAEATEGEAYHRDLAWWEAAQIIRAAMAEDAGAPRAAVPAEPDSRAGAEREAIAKAFDDKAIAADAKCRAAWTDTEAGNAIREAAEARSAAKFVRALHPAPPTASGAAAQVGEGLNDSDALDAARFRALMRCGRISMQGSCGVNAKSGERTYPDQPGAVHFGAEFWVEPEATPSSQTIWGRHCLRALADDILAFEGADRGAQTDALVERFAVALKAKLRASEAKYGWQDGWLKPSWSADCQRDLARHVAKGDPLDVAAYAAFCWHHGWPTAVSSYQDKVAAWVAEVSKDDPFDLAEHRDRFVEEALELAQSLNQTAADAHALVDYVFGRPVGDTHQEMGGTMVTLAKLASAAGLDMAEAGDAELNRCWRSEVLEKIRRKRLTRHGRGPLPGISQPATPTPAPHPVPAKEDRAE